MIEFRSNEWYKSRAGKITGSAFGYIMSKPADKTSLWAKKALQYLEFLAVQQHLDDYYKRPDNIYTKWGIDHENDAIESFSKRTGLSVKEAGFTPHSGMADVGVTPDGVINNPDGTLTLIQVKCPYNRKYHQTYLKKIQCADSLKKTRIAYYWQLQGEMWVMNAEKNYFVSYDPRLKDDSSLHYAVIERNDQDIELLKERISKAIDKRDEIKYEFDQGNRWVPNLRDYFF